MSLEPEVWLPGSFTKNFSWGPISSGTGLEKLHNAIRVGFKDVVEDVRRSKFRRRVEGSGGPDYIPLNFFLFNRIADGADTIICDELVFQAISFGHSSDFDRLAIFAFNLSRAGVWRGAGKGQRYPALWANAYIRERVASTYGWNTKNISADDIEQFVSKDARYKGKTSRKLATNLNYLYKLGDIRAVESGKIERWWVNALFLALDRLIEDQRIDGTDVKEPEYAGMLERSGFLDLTGGGSTDKELAIKHLVKLYSACGGRNRFSEEHVLSLIQVRFRDIQAYLSNDKEPGGALHPTNPRVLKTIPSVCASLAREVGFEYISALALENFSIEEYVKAKAQQAIDSLRAQDIRSSLTADDLLRMTRGR